MVKFANITRRWNSLSDAERAAELERYEADSQKLRDEVSCALNHVGPPESMAAVFSELGRAASPLATFDSYARQGRDRLADLARSGLAAISREPSWRLPDARTVTSTISCDAAACRPDANRQPRDERAVDLERLHFDHRHMDSGRIWRLYHVTKLRPLDIVRCAQEISKSGPGKYDRAHLLAPVMRRALDEGVKLAQAGEALEPSPPEIAAQLKEISRMGDDIDAAIEYAITGDCSALQRERRISALLRSHMRRQYEFTREQIETALPPQCPGPLSIATACTDAGRPELKMKRGDVGRLVNAKKGDRTREGVYDAAAAIIAAHGDLATTDTEKIAGKVKVTARHVRRILKENDTSAEIERRVADIQGGHSRKADMPF